MNYDVHITLSVEYTEDDDERELAEHDIYCHEPHKATVGEFDWTGKLPFVPMEGQELGFTLREQDDNGRFIVGLLHVVYDVSWGGFVCEAKLFLRSGELDYDMILHPSLMPHEGWVPSEFELIGSYYPRHLTQVRREIDLARKQMDTRGPSD